jgi:endonuclease/exonuclease/phosphatase family metal-dependent hydrolase
MGAAKAIRKSICLAIVALLAVLVVSHATSFAQSEAKDNATQVRVMSFNIRYGTANDGANSWERRREMVFDVLRKNKPAVVGLQEALDFQIAEICEAVGGYGRIGVGRDDGKTRGEYSAILYASSRFRVDDSGTFWLSDTPEVPGSITWGNACTRICTWARLVDSKSGAAFYMFNTHLDHISQPSREKSAILLAGRIAAREHAEPFVLTGDFNVGERNPVVLYLKGRARLGAESVPVAMLDTFRLVEPNATEVGTFNAFKGNRTGEKIDYIFTEGGVGVPDARILRDNVEGRYPSDHFPVTAKLRFPSRTTYYIDSATGHDAGDGTSPDRAWKTLEAVNSKEFSPGDRILLKAGTSYDGALRLRGSGTKDRCITLDMYGRGPRPRIDGGGVRDTLLLENVEYWEINNLEITNLGAERADWRTGVRISADNYGTMHHIRLRNLYVHDVNGSNSKSREGCGIFFECRGPEPSRFDGLRIENCHLVRTDRNGICGRSSFTSRPRNWFASLNVVIRGNLLDDIGGDCIKPWGCDGCLVEHNVVRGGRRRAEDYAAGIWPWSCDNTVIQFNEVSGMRGTKDGQGFDSDYNSRNSLFQYNYSHDNDGGFMLICTPAPSRRNIGNIGTVIRYNISYNDGARIFHIGGPCSGTKIYNNVFHVPEGRDILAVYCTDWGGWADDTSFFNNIFYVEGKVRYEFGQSTHNVFSHNVFYGNHQDAPKDPFAIVADPKFVKPGSGADGLDSLEGYKLAAGSPCIGAGAVIDDCGDRDFWGAKIPKGERRDIGAHAFGVR